MSSSNSFRILLAEDEEHIAKLVRFKLEKEGFSVSWAKDGKEALDFIQKDSWDVIVLDVMMPYLDGWRVLNQLRVDQNATPVLMLTAKGTEDDILKSIELGATRFLRKPFDPADLVEILNEMLERNSPAPSIWETDPEMKKMREEFVDSFSDRKAILRKCLVRLSGLASLTNLAPSLNPSLTPGSMSESDSADEIELITFEIRIVAHNLAGIASNYGFTELGTKAMKIDDELALESKTRTTEELASYCHALDLAMA